jgi:hypothetical protein
MQSAVISCHVSRKLKERAIDCANEEGMSLSRYVSGILTSYFNDKAKEDDGEREDGDCPCFPKADLDRILEEADDPKNCIEYESVEDLIKHMHEVAREVKNKQAL